MSIFAVEYVYDGFQSAAMDSLRPQHRAFLGDLVQTGQVKLAGPFVQPESPAALIIVLADSATQALQILEPDPFYQEGLIKERLVREWNVVLGAL